VEQTKNEGIAARVSGSTCALEIIEGEEGKYQDVALNLSPSVKYPNLGKGPDPMPFSGMSGQAEGGR
jgi:hypothetical protein